MSTDRKSVGLLCVFYFHRRTSSVEHRYSHKIELEFSIPHPQAKVPCCTKVISYYWKFAKCQTKRPQPTEHELDYIEKKKNEAIFPSFNAIFFKAKKTRLSFHCCRMLEKYLQILPVLLTLRRGLGNPKINYATKQEQEGENIQNVQKQEIISVCCKYLKLLRNILPSTF